MFNNNITIFTVIEGNWSYTDTDTDMVYAGFAFNLPLCGTGSFRDEL